MDQLHEEGTMSNHLNLDSANQSRQPASPPTGGRGLAAALVSVCLFAAACGSDAEDTDASSSSVVAEATTTVADGGSDRTIVTTDEDVDGASTTTTEADEPTTTAASGDGSGDDGVAGEPLDFGPSAGTPLAIVGVAFDDTLNFRAGPSPDAEILETFGPLSDDLDTSALGEAWAAPSGVWWKVDVAGSEAWANQAFLGGLGNTSSMFDEISTELDTLQYDTVEAAALAVAELRASEDPESRIVFAGEPLLFEIGGVAIVDVLDLGDDSVKGERIRVDVDVVFDEASGEEGAQDVDYVVVSGVEITPICARGVSGGLCT